MPIVVSVPPLSGPVEGYCRVGRYAPSQEPDWISVQHFMHPGAYQHRMTATGTLLAQVGGMHDASIASGHLTTTVPIQ